MVDIRHDNGTFNFGEQTAIADLPPFPGDPTLRPPDAPRFQPPPPDIMTLQSPEIAAFPEQWKEDYIGLLYLGYLEDTVELAMHNFIVRTLTVGEKIEISRIVRDLQGMLGYNRAYKAAVVAAGLTYVDGRPVLSVEKKKAPIKEKYEYVISEWHDIVIDKLYLKINELELKVVQIAYELGMVDAPPQILTNAAVEQEMKDEFVA